MSAPEKKKIIILGALSAIAEATARALASEQATLLLAGRDANRLSQVARDLEVRGIEKAIVWPIDLAAADNKATELEGMVAALGGNVDAVLLFYGVLGDQRQGRVRIARNCESLSRSIFRAPRNGVSPALRCSSARRAVSYSRSDR